MTAESDWATFRDQGGVTAKRAFMAGREVGYWAGTRAEIDAVYMTGITEAPTPPSPLTRAVIKASRWVWGLALIGAAIAGSCAFGFHSQRWGIVALALSLTAIFAAVARMDSHGHEREAAQSALVVAGAALYLVALTALVLGVWGAV